jgi:hypothetical protein
VEHPRPRPSPRLRLRESRIGRVGRATCALAERSFSPPGPPLLPTRRRVSTSKNLIARGRTARLDPPRRRRRPPAAGRRVPCSSPGSSATTGFLVAGDFFPLPSFLNSRVPSLSGCVLCRRVSRSARKFERRERVRRGGLRGFPATRRF